MTTFDIFIGAILALSVYELIHVLVKDITYRIKNKKRRKVLDEMLANLTSFDNCDDDCDICNDEPTVTIKRTTKKAVAKKKTVKKAAPKRKTR